MHGGQNGARPAAQQHVSPPGASDRPRAAAGASILGPALLEQLPGLPALSGSMSTSFAAGILESAGCCCRASAADCAQKSQAWLAGVREAATGPGRSHPYMLKGLQALGQDTGLGTLRDTPSCAIYNYSRRMGLTICFFE